MFTSIRARRRSPRARLFLQGLERRDVPASLITVNTLADAGAGSLRQAIIDANSETGAFVGQDTIDFSLGGTITLASALPTIAQPLVISGSGQTISGANLFRVFKVDNGAGVLNVAISDLTITSGNAGAAKSAGTTATDGGAVVLQDDNVTLTRVVMTGNATGGEGGAIGVGPNGTLNMFSCTVTGNNARVGGGIYFADGGQLTMEGCTISGNSANSTDDYVGGGGLYFYGKVIGDGVMRIINSTISGNSAQAKDDASGSSGGGGICLYAMTGTLDLISSTVTNNSVNTAGGGISSHLVSRFGSPCTVLLRNTILSGNSAGVYFEGRTDTANTIVSSNGAIGDVSGFNYVDKGGNFIGGILNLDTLKSNGGLTQTHALLAGSLAINAGVNAAPSGTDQRGPTYARKVGASVDIGAYEFGSVPGTPTGSLSSLTLSTAGGTDQSVTVLYGDDGTVNTASLGSDDLLVTGPGGYSKNASLTGFKVLNAGRVEATYSIAANSLGNATKWDGNDNGTYTISVVAGKVTDTLANAVTADAIANLVVNVPFPAGVATAPNIQTAQLGTTSNTVTVTYSHQLNISSATLGNNDIRVKGPGGYDKLGTFVSSVPSATDATKIVATYTIPANGGTWDGTDLGTYTINMEPSAVTDIDGIGIPTGQIGAFSVALPQVYVVNSTSDTGTGVGLTGDLRYCLNAANANAADGPDTITFSAGVFSGATTITLTGGQITLTDGLVFNGPALKGPADPLLTIDAGSASRFLSINVSTTIKTLSFSNIRVINGAANTENTAVNSTGGAVAIYQSQDTVSFTDCSFENNACGNFGGAIGTAAGAGVLTTITLTRCKFIGNTNSLNFGGAVYMDANTDTSVTVGNVLTITDCVFDKNTASGNGGAVGIRMLGTTTGGKLTVTGTTFSNNTAGAFAGAFSLLSGTNGTATFRNCTFSANSAIAAAGGRGGAIAMGNGFSGALNIQNTTMFGNLNLNGGAISQTSGSSAINFESSIIYGNTTTTGNPDFTGGSVTAKNSIMFDKVGTTFTDKGGNLFGASADPLLEPLANLGGLTQVHRPGPFSPAREAGSNPGALTTDQRGAGFPRLLGGKVDIGSVESIDPNPIASSQPANVTAAGGTSYAIDVSYSDDVGIKVSSLGTGDITVAGPGGFSATPTFTKVDFNFDGTPRVATYTFTPPGGAWDLTDNGTYTVTLAANQVEDNVGNKVKAGQIGAFNVGVASTFVVTTTADTGAGSLRDAIAKANAQQFSADSITFDKTVFASAQTIKLTGGELLISDPVNIVGPGASLVTVSGELATRVFKLDGPGTIAVSISDLTIANASGVGDGGGILNTNEGLTLSRVTMTGNTTSGSGAAIFLGDAAGTIVATDCTLTKNSAGGNGGVFGTVTNSALISFNRCTITQNSAANGGAFFMETGNITVENSLIANNTAGADGGAYRGTSAIAVMVFRNCTISNNSANNGGAFSLDHYGGPLSLQNCTVTQNNAASEGGAIYHFGNTNPQGPISMVSSIVAGNTVGSGTAPNVYSGFAGTSYSNTILGSFGPNMALLTDGGGNLALGTDPMLSASLANNGGPTQTYSLQAGSPAIDKGSNPGLAVFDQRGVGFDRVRNGVADIGAFEVQAVGTPAKITAIAVNGGGAQRSMVTSIKVSFSEAVTFLGGVAGAFVVERTGPSGAVGSVAINAIQTGSDVNITFVNGGTVSVDPGSSLADGNYKLTVIASKVQGFTGTLDGNGNGSAQGSPTDDVTSLFHRLYGDSDGDKSINASDFVAFRQTFGGISATFDYDGDGSVSAGDFVQFRLRFGAILP